MKWNPTYYGTSCVYNYAVKYNVLPRRYTVFGFVGVSEKLASDKGEEKKSN